jgi:hypothetical protein
MRKALNENPMVQAAVLGVGAIIFAVILFTSILKKDDSSSTATTPAPAAATSEPAATTDPAASTEAPGSTSDPAPSTGGAGSTAIPAPGSTVTPPPTGGTPADGLLPSKGLPQDVLVAFAKNKTIALLVVDPKGLADKQVERFTETLRSRDDVEVFVVDVGDIAKYARITQGVSVSRTPALVVVRPRKLTGSVPVATVSYGFRGPRSINQAVDDAVYQGKQVPSYP